LWSESIIFGVNVVLMDT